MFPRGQAAGRVAGRPRGRSALTPKGLLTFARGRGDRSRVRGVSGAVDAGIGLLIGDREGHEVTGVCGRALFFAAGTVAGPWMTGRRPGVIAALPRPAHRLAGAAWKAV